MAVRPLAQHPSSPTITMKFQLWATLSLISLYHTLTAASTFQLPSHLPRRTIANVSVLDTPLIRASLTYTNLHVSPKVYKHIMRTWLFGTLMLQHNTTLMHTVDEEVFSLAAILHDLGFERTPNSTIVTSDRRFEVDGAIAARDFIRSHHDGKKWEERRVQLVWDAIALHGIASIAWYKEPEVNAVQRAVGLDFSGANFGITAGEYGAVVREYPNWDLKENVIDTFIWLCATKSETTYDTFIQPYGEMFVPGYNATGHRAIDMVLAMNRTQPV